MEALYVCAFSNGALKVGRSSDPAARIAQHQKRVSCVGVSLTNSRHAVCNSRVTAAEADLIARCAERSSERYSNEWFIGIPFDEACRLMQECAEREYAEPAPIQPATVADQIDAGKYVSWLAGRRYQCLWDDAGRHHWVDTQPSEPHWPESAVMRWDLRARDWPQLWPELIDHPCALLFAPTHPHRDGPPQFTDWVKSWPAGYDGAEIFATLPAEGQRLVRARASEAHASARDEQRAVRTPTNHPGERVGDKKPA